MIIPIGLEQDTVRRLPWVSIAIIAINVAVFLTVGLGAGQVEERIARDFEAMVRYWATHPYLPFPERALPRQLSEREREQIEVMSETARSLAGRAAAERGDLPAERRELEGLVDAFLDSRSTHPYEKYGLVPARVSIVALFTCMFMHAGWLHLLGNLLIFYLSGPFVEDVFGRPLFLALYLVSGIAASLSFVLAFPASTAPLVGASGAIAGVMGAFLVRFARMRIRFFYWVWIFFRGTFMAPAWLMLPLWLAEQVFMGSLVQSEGGVAYWAHVGGFVFGFGAALVVKQARVEERFVQPAIEREISLNQHPALDEGMDLLVRGDLAGAKQALGRVLEGDPRNPDANLAMWQCFAHEGRQAEGAQYLARVVEDEIRRGENGLAVEHWREMVSEAGSAGQVAMRWRLAGALEGGDPGAVAEVLRSIAADPAAGVLQEKAARKLEAMGAVGAAVAGSGTVSGVAPAAPAPAVARPGITARAPLPPVPDFHDLAVADDGDGSEDPVAVSGGPPFSVERCEVEGVREEGIVMRGEGSASELLPFFVIERIVVAGITAAPRSFLVVDLVLTRDSSGPRKVLRLVSSSFDPRKLLNRYDMTPLEAFRRLVVAFASAAGAELVPQSVAAAGSRIPTYAGLEAYEAEVLTRLLQGGG